MEEMSITLKSDKTEGKLSIKYVTGTGSNQGDRMGKPISAFINLR
jgi:hypothetical protein